MSSTGASPPYAAAPARVDPRGQQFAAALTSVVLVVVLLLAPEPLGVALLAAQAVLFAAGAGPASRTRRTPGSSRPSSGRVSARRASSRTSPRRASPRA